MRGSAFKLAPPAAPKRWGIPAAAAIAAVASTGPSAAADWERAVGRLNLSGFDWQQHCTATLITRRAILTAAHCVYVDSRGRWAKPAEVNFLPGYDRGNYITHMRATRIVRADGFTPTRSPSLADAAKDWAIVVTREPAPAGITPVPLRASMPEPPLVAAGYVQDRPHALTLRNGCRIRDGGAPGLRIVAHTCPLGRGASGGPLIAHIAAGPRVVGVQTSQWESTGYAIPASTFAPEVAAALTGPPRAQLRAGAGRDGAPKPEPQ